MSCCSPEASIPAQRERPTSQTTETPKDKAAGCCGGGAKKGAKTPSSAPQEAGARSEGCHTLDR